jgi:hypothetical protein
MHAERIKARTKAGKEAVSAGQSTAELYAARILPGYRADEALREEARKNELRARGVSLPGDDEEEPEEDEQEAAVVDPLDNPERRSARVAWQSVRTGGYLSL